MYKRVGNKNENEGRALADSAIQTKTSNSRQHFRFIDNRSGAIAQRMNNKSLMHALQTKRKETSTLIDASYKIAQRRVFINQDPVVRRGYANNCKVGPNDFLVPQNAQAWVDDGYGRYYANNQEFDNHANGQPSKVGLARKLGIWFRLHHLPGVGGRANFFVLGEAHGAFGYRELVAETNQSGKVLGEGEANTVFSAQPGTQLEATQLLANGAQEFTMENRIAKSYFALATAAETMSNPRPVATPPNVESEALWLGNYQAAKIRTPPGAFNVIPNYLDAQGHKVVADFGPGGNQYDAAATIRNNILALTDGLRIIPQSIKSAFTVADQQLIDDTVQNLESIKVMADIPLKAIIIKSILPDIQKLAILETERMTGRVAPSLSRGCHEKFAFKLRNEGMFSSVQKARARGDFIMAVMGDNHRKDLNARFTAEGMPVVSHTDFLQGHVGLVDVKDALEPQPIPVSAPLPQVQAP